VKTGCASRTGLSLFYLSIFISLLLYFKIFGNLVAGGVFLLRSLFTSPSITTIPIPGKSPSRTLSRRVFPAEC
jgi:hypothetical protein